MADTKRSDLLDKDVREAMIGYVATGVAEYLRELVSRLFKAPRSRETQDCVVDGLVQAIHKYEKTTGRPIAHALGVALLDDKETK